MAQRTRVGRLLLSYVLISLLSRTASAELLNVSTRGVVGTGDDVLIAGFIIGGTTPLPVLIRGRGPSMGGAPFFVQDTLANPLLQLFTGQSLIAENDDWQQTQALEIIASGLDPCLPNPGQSRAPPDCLLESAILVTLPPGAYTAILRGVGGGTGVGLVEVFELTGGAVTIPDLIGIYSGSVSIAQSRCQNPFNNGTFGGSATVNINGQTGSLFSGAGRFNIISDSITFNFSGTVTGRALAGNFTTIAVSSGIRTTGTFTGSIIVNVLTIDFSGRATAGETCTVDGLLSASR